MQQGASKPKLTDETSLKSKLVLSQTHIQQSLREPFHLLPILLTALTYLQCLKYPIDGYSPTWFGQPTPIFSYIDLSFYLKGVSSLVASSIGLMYCGFGVASVVGGARLGRGWGAVEKIGQLGFGSFLFIGLVGDHCRALREYFMGVNNSMIEVVLAFLSLILFTSLICLQTYTRYDFILKSSSMPGIIKLSNWSGVTLLLYMLTNELTSQFSQPNTSTGIIIMALSIALHTFIIFLKAEHEEQTPFRIQLSMLATNILAILILLCKFLLKLQLDIDLVLFLSLISILAISKLEYFNLVFQLENVNKWSTSQIMISYAAKLRKLLMNYGEYYFNTLFLGYVEIHQQKCDNQACPLRNVGNDDEARKMRFQDIIRKIYNDGLKLSPINPELLLEYAIFHYEIGAKEKSMKMLLEIKEDDLPLDKFYKYSRLKKMIHQEISEIPNQDFLDLLSEIKVKELQQKITKKFQESALISLQFWSILNEDHPDFRKLTEIGKQKVQISTEVHSLYREITKIAHSQRITCLYIHYLSLIENQEKLFSQVEDQIKNDEGFEDKIVIQDWANNCSPIMIVSIEEENLGAIIDLNTTCSTVLGHQKFDFLGRDIKSIFPGVLVSQIETFMDVKAAQNNEQYFYIGYSNGYALKLTRKIQHYSRIETGLSLIITLQHKFTPNTGFLIFNNESKLVIMSSSCLQLLDFQDNLLEMQNYWSDLFDVPITGINEEKTILTLGALLKDERAMRYRELEHLDQRCLERMFNFWKCEYEQFTVVNFNMIKSAKNAVKGEEQSVNLFDPRPVESDFVFSIGNEESQFIFIGSSASMPVCPALQLALTPAQQPQPQTTPLKDYSQSITTLRLHENYIKVIEQSQPSNEDKETQSQASTNNELIAQTNHISKADEQKIFESRESYHSFIDSRMKKVYIRTGLGLAVLCCVAFYVGLYFTLLGNYRTIAQKYYRFALGNRVVGEIAQANRIIHQTKYYSKVPNPQTSQLLLQNYNTTLERLQSLMKNYTLPYPMNVSIDPNTVQEFRSDQFILSFLSEFSKVGSFVGNAGGFDGLVLESNSSWFVEVNGNATKQIMYFHAQDFKNKSKIVSQNSMNFSLIFNCCGIVMALILTVIILLLLRKIDEYKIEILSIFLQTTQKDIQNYSQKTQNFLVTLHVDESAQNNNETADQQFENKKNSHIMFAKKKRFKTTHYQKSQYFLLSTFFFFASAYFVHILTFSVQKNLFIVDAIQYFDVVSRSSDVLASNQAKIYKELNAQLPYFGSNMTMTNTKLSGEINTALLEYQRDFFIWHYKTYGSIDQYHQQFAKVFMRDICNGQIKIKHACNAGIMATNGTLLMLTDLTIQNQHIDYTKKLSPLHYFSMQTVKQAHLFLLQEVMTVSDQFFASIYENIMVILVIWAIGIGLAGVALGGYVERNVIGELRVVKGMLKFFPVSFARSSEGVKRFVGEIIQQQGP